MDGPRGYRARTRFVAYEELDDELVLLNLDTGVYGTVGGSGVGIWHALVPGATVPELVAALETQYGVPADDVTPAVQAFLDDLVAHELAGEGDPEPDRPPIELPGTAYAEPRLEVFDDMVDLLQLDPVHDVDRRGWPHGGG